MKKIQGKTKTLIVAILVISLLASGSLAVWEKVYYRKQTEEEITHINQVMMRDILLSQMDVAAPLKGSALHELPLEVLAYMYNNQETEVVMLNTYLSYSRYPEQTIAILKEYGHVELLSQIFELHGSYKPIPVIHFAMTQPEAWDAWMDRADILLDDLFNEGSLKSIPVERRLVLKTMAKMASPVHGDSYLGRFQVYPDGRIERHWTKSVVSVTEGFFTGSISEIEYKVKAGATDELTWIDWGSGALEVAVIGGVVFKAIAGVTHAVGKGAQGVKAANAGSKAASLADDVLEEGTKASGAAAKTLSGGIGRANQVLFKYFPKSLLLKTAGYTFAGVTAYIIIKHPGYTYQYLGVVAEMLGVNTTAFRAVCLFIALMIVLNFFLTVTLYIRPIIAVVAFCLRILDKSVSPLFRPKKHALPHVTKR